MRFAENNRISHRQLYRQLVLAFLAPFLLCLFSRGNVLGTGGIAGTATAVAVLLFYVIFLIRLAPSHHDLVKSAGGFWGRVIGGVFLLYILFTAAFLLKILEIMTPASLIAGVSGKALSLTAVLACSFGTHRGMQRRGRMAEVSGGLLLGAVVVMMLLCLGQAKLSYLGEMLAGASLTGESFLTSAYSVLCAFAGLGLLPFVLGEVEKSASAGKAAGLGVLTLGGILIGMEILLPAVFGWKRLLSEEVPILPLLSGANLPGNVLARFDVLWMGFLLYSLLFAIGSLFHYGHTVMNRAHLGSGRFWMPAAVYGLSLLSFENQGIEDYYGIFLGYVFVPALLAMQIYLFVKGRRRRKKKAALASVLCISLLLGGCAGVEPEKRMYPLALGVAEAPEGGFTLVYGMPDLPQATGQGKPQEDGSKKTLAISGADFSEIEAIYNRSQEKYLDMGHLQVLILSDGILADEKWAAVLAYLKEEPLVGENVYVFRTQDVEAVLGWEGAQGNSLGEYLIGILENRTSGQKRLAVTLRELYHEKYRAQNLPTLPVIRLQEEQIYVYSE